MNDAPFRLRSLGCGARLGMTGLVFVLMGGLAASVVFIHSHLRNRDEQPKLTLTDVQGAYHGVTAPAPIVRALQGGHPPALAGKDRDALLDWLLGKKDAQGNRPPAGNPQLFETYDNIDAGDANPADIVAKSCITCHSRKAAPTPSGAIPTAIAPMDNWEDIKKIAFSKEIVATPLTGLIISTHAHALALGTLGILAGLLLVCTRFPRALVNLLFMLIGVGLLADLGGWWLARQYEQAVYLLLTGGAAFIGGTGVALLLILLELWLPRRD